MISKEFLSPAELERYSRQILLPNFGTVAQEQLKKSRVLCIGAGGLGSPVITYLATSGVGTIGVIDHDIVERSNLARQILHWESRLGLTKVQSAANAIHNLNPECNFIGFEHQLTGNNAHGILTQFDVIIDGSDNFATTYLANDTTQILGKPYIWGGIYQTAGQVMTFHSESEQERLNLRDIFPHREILSDALVEYPESNNRVITGVFSPVCGIIGSIMAAEAIKIITGYGQLLTRRMLVIDALTMHFSTVHVDKSQ